MIESKGPVTLSGAGWVKSAHFLSMHASERLGVPYVFEFEVVSDTPMLSPNDVLGEQVTISVLVDTEQRHYSGIATSLQSLGVQSENFVYRLVLRPWLWLLSRTTNCRIFQDQTAVDIIKKVFRDRGFSDFEERLTSSYLPRPYVVQYRETDLHFVLRLMEDEGIYFYFTHELGKHVLVMADSLSAHDTTPFYDSLPHLPPDSQRAVQIDYLETWEMVFEVESGAFALTDYDFQAPRASLDVLKALPESHSHADYEVFDFPGNYLQAKQGETIAMLRLEEAKATAQRALADGNARGLLVGGLFMLSEHPQAELNREYLVVSQKTALRGHALESGGQDLGLSTRVSIVVIPSDRQYRAPRTTQKPVVHGAQTATVVGPEGEEIWTDEFGRVKLEFHWDRQSPGDETSSCWVRVAQVWAGSNFGGIHLPRIGQEVIVQFLDGDPDRPIITGRVYNADNMPPYELPANQTQSGLKSRSTKGGVPANFNEIRFEDKLGQEELFIQAEKTQTTKVKGSQSIGVDGSRSVSVGGDQSTTVTKNETQTYKAERKMDVTATNSDTIHGAHTGTYLAGRTLTVSGGDDKLTVATNRTAAVTSAYDIIAGGKYQVTNGSNIILLQGAGAAMTNGQCSVAFNGPDANLEAPGKIQLTAGTEISLACGAASIVIKSNGTIEISGAQKVNVGSGSSAVACEPTGVTVSGTKVSSAAVGMHEISGALIKIN
jgi:type VI secretion system secreted protein VgrG